MSLTTAKVDRPDTTDCTKSIKNFLTHRVTIGAVMITALVAAILGGIALVGACLPPQSPLGVLAGTFGLPGTFATLAAGLVLFTVIALALLVNYCSEHKKAADKEAKRVFRKADINPSDSPSHLGEKEPTTTTTTTTTSLTTGGPSTPPKDNKTPSGGSGSGPEIKLRTGTGTGSPKRPNTADTRTTDTNVKFEVGTGRKFEVDIGGLFGD